MQTFARVIATLPFVALCAVLVTGAGAATTALPQQSGVVDLLTQANLRINGAGADAAAAEFSGAGDVNGDGRGDVIIGAEGTDATGRSGSGSAFVVFGRASLETVELAALGDRGFRIDGAAAGDQAGSAVAGAGDVNGDGRGDVLVAAPSADQGASSSGSVYVVFGKTSTTRVDLASLGDGGFRIDGAGLQHGLGYSVSGAGDVNGDGRADVIAGAISPNDAYIVFGKTNSTTVRVGALGAGGFRIGGADSAGYSVAGAGDVNGDGRQDVLVGAANFEPDGIPTGAAFVVFGKTSTTAVDLAALGAGGFRIDGAAGGDGAGESVSGAGDVNGDGRADVILGASDTDNNGRSESGSAFVVFGRTATTTVELSALGDGGFRIDGATAGESAGHAVSGLGDVNGDGRPDLLLGAPLAANNGRTDSGSAYVVYGKAATTAVDLAALGTGGFRMDGAAALDYVGGAVSGPGDVNGDKRPDVLLGAIGAGAAFAVLGFGQPKLEYEPLRTSVGAALKPHAPKVLERTGGGLRFEVTPPLPAGLSLGGLGAVRGTPKAARAETTHTVTMIDLVGQVSAPLVVSVGADRTAPRLTLQAALRQRALRQKRIVLRAKCATEACALLAQGAFVIVGSNAVIPLKAAKLTRFTTAQRTLNLRITKTAQQRLARFLARGKRARAIVTVRARDRLGNARQQSRTIFVLR